MNENKLSLTKKLDGGYLHVKKKENTEKSSIKKGGYSNYLRRTRGHKGNKSDQSQSYQQGGGHIQKGGHEKHNSNNKLVAKANFIAMTASSRIE